MKSVVVASVVASAVLIRPDLGVGTTRHRPLSERRPAQGGRRRQVNGMVGSARLRAFQPTTTGVVRAVEERLDGLEVELRAGNLALCL